MIEIVGRPPVSFVFVSLALAGLVCVQITSIHIALLKQHIEVSGQAMAFSTELLLLFMEMLLEWLEYRRCETWSVYGFTRSVVTNENPD